MTTPPRLKPGSQVQLTGYVMRYDEKGDAYQVALRPPGLGPDDPGPVQHVWLSPDEISAEPTKAAAT